jgi:hypothetical protein
MEVVWVCFDALFFISEFHFGHSVVLLQPDYSGEGRGAQKEMRYVQYGQLLCFSDMMTLWWGIYSLLTIKTKLKSSPV